MVITQMLCSEFCFILPFASDLCVLYSFLSLCDMSRRVRGARFGCDEGTKFDWEMMLDLYKLTAGMKLSGLWTCF